MRCTWKTSASGCNIYEALPVKHAGGKEQITLTEPARKWNVPVVRICQERDKIIKMIKKMINPKKP